MAEINSVLIAGAAGMVGSAVCRRFADQGMRVVPITRRDFDLSNAAQVGAMYQAHKDVDAVVIAAARVGGIRANDTYPAEFLYQNMMIEANLIHGAHVAGIDRLMFLGSSCIYPRLAEQPMREEALLTGPLEPTNEPYAIAKIAGIKLCESYHRQYGRDYRSLMPTNLYGENDNFAGEDSHVIPALIKKFHAAQQAGARQVEIWGTGKARREFLHVDDLAAAVEFITGLPTERYWSVVTPQLSHINVGTGSDISIRELAELLKRVSGFEGELAFDTTRPDGTPRKLLDVTKASRLGWHPTVPLEQGLQATYRWYLQELDRQSTSVRV